MGYDHNHYNYQIAVIFAILIGGILLLGIFAGGIYFVCVNSMRGDDKKRLHTNRNSAANWPAQAPAYTAPYRERPSSVTMYNPAVPTTQQSYDFETRSPMTQQPPMATTLYNPPAQYSAHPNYSQVPLVTAGNEYNAPRSSQLQPDVIYTQGPSGFVQSTPVEYTIQQPAYHQSSV